MKSFKKINENKTKTTKDHFFSRFCFSANNEINTSFIERFFDKI